MGSKLKKMPLVKEIKEYSEKKELKKNFFLTVLDFLTSLVRKKM